MYGTLEFTRSTQVSGYKVLWLDRGALINVDAPVKKCLLLIANKSLKRGHPRLRVNPGLNQRGPLDRTVLEH